MTTDVCVKQLFEYSKAGPLERLSHGRGIPSSADGFIHMLAETVGYASPEIAVAFLAIDLDQDLPVSIFESYEGNQFDGEHRVVSDFLSVHHLKRTVRRPLESPRTIEGYLAAFRYNGVLFLAATRNDFIQAINFTDFRDHCLFEWAQTFYPGLVPIRLSSRTLLEFFGSLNQSVSNSVRLLRTTMRFPQEGFQTTERTEELSTVLERLEDEGGFLDRATVQIAGDNGYVASVGRNGLLAYHCGDLRRLLGDVVELLGGEKAQRDKIGKVVEESSNTALGVLEISFSRSISFCKFELAQALVEALEKASPYSVTVLHGNPYLHLAIMDLAHGSTYSLYSREDGGLRIYAGPSADRTSLEHLVDWISARFCDVSQLEVSQVRTAPRGRHK